VHERPDLGELDHDLHRPVGKPAKSGRNLGVKIALRRERSSAKAGKG
jgi:hypothetical protein